jgi:hypothetical protein
MGPVGDALNKSGLDTDMLHSLRRPESANLPVFEYESAFDELETTLGDGAGSVCVSA